ncbi:MAG: phospholipase D-like domain-containing protein [Candidatus Methanomethylophilaceae archaeon]
MDAHRKLIACIAVFVMLACMVPVAADCESSDAAGSTNGVLLYEVSAVNDKGVSLKNYSTATIDLKDYVISDGEGSITFSKSFKLSAGETVTLALTVTETSFTNHDNVYHIGENSVGITTKGSGSFNPAKDGDDIYLYNPDGKIIDAMCFGSKVIDDKEIWSGSSVIKSTKYFLQRIDGNDTDSAADWIEIRIIPGQTQNPLEVDKYTATVTPFLFPDSGGIPIYQALEKAQESVFIEMYELRSPNIYALLIQLEERGVEVTILHEGAPVGNTVPQFASNMKALINAGGEVRFIGGTDVDRFENVHAKFAIIDMETVIITSENWSASNCNGSLDDDPYKGNDGNRGWGVIVENSDYAEYMKAVFDNDNSVDYGDTYDFNSKYSQVSPATLTYKAPETATFTSYTAPITPVLSNDNSYEAIEYVITNATERVYSQQQSLSNYYADLGETSPVMMMARQASANPGMDAKFILGEGMSSSSKADAEQQVLLINSSTLISAATMGTPYVHNKGVIGDDLVLVTSINWTPTSVENNRESGVIINSKEVADYFAAAFNRDFSRNYTYDGFSVDISEIKTSYKSGEEVTFSVTVSPASDSYTYHWVFGDGGEKDTNVPRVAYKPADGAHELKVTVTNSAGISQTTPGITYYVGGEPTDTDKDSDSSATDGEEFDIQKMIDDYGYYIIPIIVIILGIIGAALKHR